MPPASFAWRSKCYPRSGRHTPSTWWQPHLYVTWVFVHAFCHDFGSLLLLPPCRRLAVRSLPRQNVSRGPFLQLMESIFHECERQAPPQLNAAASAALWAASEVGWLIGYCLHPRCCLCLCLWHVRSLILLTATKKKQGLLAHPRLSGGCPFAALPWPTYSAYYCPSCHRRLPKKQSALCSNPVPPRLAHPSTLTHNFHGWTLLTTLALDHSCLAGSS